VRQNPTCAATSRRLRLTSKWKIFQAHCAMPQSRRGPEAPWQKPEVEAQVRRRRQRLLALRAARAWTAYARCGPASSGLPTPRRRLSPLGAFSASRPPVALSIYRPNMYGFVNSRSQHGLLGAKGGFSTLAFVMDNPHDLVHASAASISLLTSSTTASAICSPGCVPPQYLFQVSHTSSPNPRLWHLLERAVPFLCATRTRLPPCQSCLITVHPYPRDLHVSNRSMNP
jgi:hypothetical protein